MLIGNREIEPRKPRELQEGEEREPRKPKRKVAVLIGYCGTGYHGMQVNPPQKTIEGDLFDAFVKAGAISKDNSDDPKKSSFMRAARTDKGVHAAGNVVSLKLIVEDEDVVEKINQNLPEQIRVWGINRTNKSFECRKLCGSRVYEYLIPSYSFLPPKPGSAFAERLKEVAKEKPGVTKDDPEGGQFWADVEKKLAAEGVSKEDLRSYQEVTEEGEEAPEESSANSKLGASVIKKIKTIENASRRDYRISEERLEKIRECFKLYEGVHNFHNFTLGKGFKDASSQRFMKSLAVSEPKLINGTEWLSIKIHGQSFMLHQIRKMVAMVALTIRYGAPESRITEAFGEQNISIPKAPSLGLLLEQPVYEAYNRKLETFGRDAITFEPYQEQMEAFKTKHIYDKIYSDEAKENVFHAFFAFMDSFKDSPFDYFTAHGITATTKQQKISDEDKQELQGDNEG